MEQIFLDQSQPAQAVGGAPAPAPTAASRRPRRSSPRRSARRAAPAATTAAFAAAAHATTTRSPASSSRRAAMAAAAFRAAGFVAGDVIVAINGQRVSSADQALALVRQRAARPILPWIAAAAPSSCA